MKKNKKKKIKKVSKEKMKKIKGGDMADDFKDKLFEGLLGTDTIRPEFGSREGAIIFGVKINI